MTVRLSRVSMVHVLMVLTPSPAALWWRIRRRALWDKWVIYRILITIVHAYFLYIVLTQYLFFIVDTDDCSPDPCLYGTCIDEVSDFTCSCYVGYDVEKHVITVSKMGIDKSPVTNLNPKTTH